jgi:hypothetical protein
MAAGDTYFIAPPPGFHWRQLAQDGVQLKDVLSEQQRSPLPSYSVQINNELDPSDRIGAFPINLCQSHCRVTRGSMHS